MMKVKSIIAAVVLAVAGLCFTGCNEDDSNVGWSCIADISNMIVVGNCTPTEWNNSIGVSLTSIGGGLYTATIKLPAKSQSDEDNTGKNAEFQLLNVGSWYGGYYGGEIEVGKGYKGMSTVKSDESCKLKTPTLDTNYKLTFKVEGLKVSVKADVL